AFFVSIESAYAIPLTCNVLKSSRFPDISPSNSVKLPLTVDTIICFTENSTELCALSNLNVVILFPTFLYFIYLITIFLRMLLHQLYFHVHLHLFFLHLHHVI